MPGHPAEILDVGRGRVEIGFVSHCDRAGRSIHRGYVSGLPGGNAKPFPLAERESADTGVASQELPGVIADLAWRGGRPCIHERTIVVIGDEADLDAVRLGCNIQAEPRGVLAHRALRQVADWEDEIRELFLPEHVEYIRLVLGRVPPAQEPERPAIDSSVDASIVTGCEPSGAECGELLQESPVLDVLVTANAGIGRSPARVFVDEWLHDVLTELVLEIHHVVANPELPGDAAGSVDILDAAALPLGTWPVWPLLGPQAESHADDLKAALDEQSCRH